MTSRQRIAPQLGKRQARKPANSPKLTPERVIDFVREALAGSDELALMQLRLDHEDGRPRQLRLDVLIGAGIAQCVTEQSNMHVRAVAALLRSLPVPLQRLYGVRWTHPDKGEQLITERQVEYLFTRVAAAFDIAQALHDHPFVLDDQVVGPDGEFLGPLAQLPPALRDRVECAESCPMAVSMQQLGNRLLALFREYTGVPVSTQLAVDASVVPTHFSTKSWGSHANIDPAWVPDEAKDKVSVDLDGVGLRTASSPPAKRPSGNKSAGRDNWKSGAKTLATTREQIDVALETWEPPQQTHPRSRKQPPAGPTVTGAFTSYSDEFPQLGPDGRLVHTRDEGARNAYRGAGNNRPAQIVNGRDNHALVDGGRFPDGTPNPGLLVAYNAVPGGADKRTAALDLLSTATENGVTPSLVSMDRIYTALEASGFGHLIASDGWQLVKDLKQYQRTPKPWAPGVQYLDGFWFTAGMPDHLMDLPMPARGASTARRTECQEAFDGRAAFAFRIHGYTADGGYRLRGPAVPDRVTGTGRARKVIGCRARCENSPYFRLLPRHLPKTTCVRGEPCACSSTFTVRANQMPNSVEPLMWGTGKWAKEYARRNLSEAAFSVEQYSAGLDRHSIRVRAKKWDLAFMLVVLATWIRQFFSMILKLGAAVLDPAEWSVLQPEVFRPALEQILTPATKSQRARPSPAPAG